LTKKKKIDVLLHELVPKHKLLTNKEALDLLDKYQISVIDLPQIFEKDPVAIAIGAKEGDVIKIIRDSSTTVKTIDYYRYVKKEKA
jgi:DNA-directed RNA polymerase subunit H